MRRFIRKLWLGFWARAPRTLRVTRDGKIVLAIALASGFAGVNTGNNLLFLGWGMVLSAIVVSGILSEATLRSVRVEALTPRDARAGRPMAIPLKLHNVSQRLPAFGVDVDAQLVGNPGTDVGEDAAEFAHAPYQLRIEPNTLIDARARFVPSRRGRFEILELHARTHFPFGFFEKSRRFKTSGRVFWAAPSRVDVDLLQPDFLSRLGWSPTSRVGAGEDFFSLRPYRPGDDPKRIHWRRTARSGRLVIKETEALSARAIALEVTFGRPGDVDEEGIEYTIAVIGSLGEDLLEQGYRVGIRGPGVGVSPDSGPRHARSILWALARMEPHAPMHPGVGSDHVLRVAITLTSAIAVRDAHELVVIPRGRA